MSPMSSAAFPGAMAAFLGDEEVRRAYLAV